MKLNIFETQIYLFIICMISKFINYIYLIRCSDVTSLFGQWIIFRNLKFAEIDLVLSLTYMYLLFTLYLERKVARKQMYCAFIYSCWGIWLCMEKLIDSARWLETKLMVKCIMQSSMCIVVLNFELYITVNLPTIFHVILTCDKGTLCSLSYFRYIWAIWISFYN